MKNDIKEILKMIDKFSSKFPEQRFGQILFNLNINEFKTNKMELRDIYEDSNEKILERIENRIKQIN